MEHFCFLPLEFEAASRRLFNFSILITGKITIDPLSENFTPTIEVNSEKKVH